MVLLRFLGKGAFSEEKKQKNKTTYLLISEVSDLFCGI